MVFVMSCEGVIKDTYSFYKNQVISLQDMGCLAKEERCNGSVKQICNLLGQWEEEVCYNGSNCVEVNGIPSCQVIQAQPLQDMEMMGDVKSDMMSLDSGIIEYPCGNHCPDMEMILIQAGSFNMGSVIGNQ